MNDRVPEYLTVDEVAGILKCAPQAVRRWIQAGELAAIKLGGDRLGYRIERADLDAFAQRHRRPAMDGPSPHTD